jgi:hypothetical protein
MTSCSWLLAAALLFGAACSSSSEPAPASSNKKAPDQADSTRLQEGTVEVWTIKFPVRTTVIKQTSNAVSLQMPYPMEWVLNYLRERFTITSSDLGPRTTVFHKARLTNGNPGLFEITVKRHGSVTKIDMIATHDPSQKPLPAGSAAQAPPTSPPAAPN